MEIRKQLYGLLIVVSCALLLGRIAAVDSIPDRVAQDIKVRQIDKILADKRARLEKEGRTTTAIDEEMDKTRQTLEEEARLERPFFSANDRSRWCTIRALVEPDMRVIREVNGQPQYVWFAIDHVQDCIGWETIDMCKHTLPDEPDGKGGNGGGEGDGERFGKNDGGGYLYSTKPPLLVVLMAVPYTLLYHLSGGEICFDNQLFLIVRVTLILCNLLPIAFCWYLLCCLLEKFGTTDWGRLFTAAVVCFGTFVSTFAVTLNNHTPAVCCVVIALFAATRIVKDGDLRLRNFAVCAFFAMCAAVCDLPALAMTGCLGLYLLCRWPQKTLIAGVPMFLLVAGAFFATNYAAHQTLRPAYMNKEWYSYNYVRRGVERPSYWDNRSPIDQGEPSHKEYAIHCLVGHHGWFSLTPVWLLSLVGMGIWLFRPPHENENGWLRWLAIFTVLLTGIVLYHYLTIRQEERNYGGVTSGLRWLFWLIPFWILTLQPAADFLSKYRWTRIVALILLAVSVVSVSYPVWNPWTPPWLWYFLSYLGVPVLGG